VPVIEVILTPDGEERLDSYSERFGPYSWFKNVPYDYALLDSVREAGFLPETSYKEVLRLEEFGLIERV